jgi:hypothetical protein
MSKMGAEFVRSTVSPGGERARAFDVACNHVKNMTQARCAAVILIDSEAGSGYSVIGPLDAQILLPDVLEQMARVLRRQLSKNLQ